MFMINKVFNLEMFVTHALITSLPVLEPPHLFAVHPVTLVSVAPEVGWVLALCFGAEENLLGRLADLIGGINGKRIHSLFTVDVSMILMTTWTLHLFAFFVVWYVSLNCCLFILVVIQIHIGFWHI